MKKYVLTIIAISMILIFSGCGHNRGEQSKESTANDKEDMKMDFSKETGNVIYLAGGCFWGIEKLMDSIPGVVDVKSGYANGLGAGYANYGDVSGGNTGFRETVRVEYNPDKVSLDAILLAYFYVIDPTVTNRQGNDYGSQYQTGVYYTNDDARRTVERIAAIEAEGAEKFVVEIKPLENFYVAEEYHQDYLKKNQRGYCHIPAKEIELFTKINIDPGDYRKPAVEVIKDKLASDMKE